ncbi:6,7-dimethyl-8-ribityllumazine synthase [Candidatus Sumerlaeota bacterium]|nr:6,7-dimethyl-8-ribityllumazine synthase [Candidatus Sumerlaeota bacterium]
MPREISADLTAEGLKFAVVVSRFNDLITEQLLRGCIDCLTRHGAADKAITVIRVPGAFEIPVAVAAAARAKKHDAVIALGAVIRGETPHNEHIAAEVTKGIAQVALETGVPVTLGVLTPNTLEQAVERSGVKRGNKGAEAAASAIEMANLMKKI